MDRTYLQKMLGEGLSLAEIGRRVDRHESTVSYWVERHGLQANGRERHAARGALAREELESLVEQGMSIAEIALAVDSARGRRGWWRRGCSARDTERLCSCSIGVAITAVAVVGRLRSAGDGEG
ncbi:MAG TPA: helix-turn-helix domain-containing protein [Solirubrobacteraceae bacterium]|nr:helix-turn-helix domain-containing protein [Solirubrobacteraceae bacterium]